MRYRPSPRPNPIINTALVDGVNRRHGLVDALLDARLGRAGFVPRVRDRLLRRSVEALVERFDIEPYSDFSSK